MTTPTDPLEGEMQELIAFMGSIGFEYRPNEHYSYFAKDEGTCELTVEGAEEMFIAIKALIAKAVVEARINQSKHFKKIAHKRKDTRLDNNTYLSCVFEKEIDQEIAELQQLNTDKEKV